MGRKNIPTDIYKKINMHQGDKSVCWEWTGTFNAKDDRPYITIDGKRRPVYVISLELYTGEQANGRVARHKCDNHHCCSPHHLEWGTHQENMNDMKERERHGLTKIAVKAINNLLDDQVPHKTIAKRFGVSREAITAINNGRSHKS